ncbi:MAG: hypothetical protein FJ319_00970 [SAR202 cluster bacterium]|nr:hypothetical protein [SAR202 cluster bacterium]
MQTKLTIHLDEDLIKYAEEYAKEHGTSVSEMVAAYIAVLKSRPEKAHLDLPEVVKRLRGAAKGPADEEDYYRYPESKHR